MTLRPSRQAEVALILDTGFSLEDPQIVFIQRALCVDDPWSGQMAFPGGLSASTVDRVAWRMQPKLMKRWKRFGAWILPTAQLVGRLDDLKGPPWRAFPQYVDFPGCLMR
jgi:hypothetical protein